VGSSAGLDVLEQRKSLASDQIVATCLNHYMVSLRPFKYMKT